MRGCFVLDCKEEGDAKVTQEIRARLEAELADVRGQIEVLRRKVKRLVGDQPALEAVEADLRRLHTRLGVLEANHKKLATNGSC